ncbi:MAG TPA: hypothetical protein VNW06_04900 [Cytophagaceae bacterium]|nr:hypothetical protein [Cytophagaceae bacterium]
MKVVRLISWFDKFDDTLIGEYNVDNVSLEVFKSIFNPPPEDYLMYNPYTITEEEVEKLKNVIDFEFDFNKYFYQLDCFQANSQ